MPLTLIYWSMKGRGEVTRMVLAYLGVEYNEINPTRADWPGQKENFINEGFAFPNLPMVINEDFKVSESSAVVAYVAEKFGNAHFSGATVEDRATLKQLDSILTEAYNTFLHPCLTPQYKEGLQATTQEGGKMLKIVSRIENFLGGKQFLLGDVTYLDFVLAGLVLTSYDIYKSAGVNSPFWKKTFYDHLQRVNNLPGVKEYLQSDKAKRPLLPVIPWVKANEVIAPNH